MIDASPKGFLTNPALRWTGYRDEQQELIEPLIYRSGKGELLKVPAGTITDYASIPRVFWNLKGFSPTGDAKFPAILHDYLYSLRGSAPYFKTRREADDLLLEAMQLVGVIWRRRQTIYWAVRIFGGLHSMGQPWAKPAHQP